MPLLSLSDATDLAWTAATATSKWQRMCHETVTTPLAGDNHMSFSALATSTNGGTVRIQFGAEGSSCRTFVIADAHFV